MFTVVCALITLASIGLALYASLSLGDQRAKRLELFRQNRQLTAEIEGQKAQLATLAKLSQIPNVMERAKRLEAEIADRLGKAQAKARGVMADADEEASSRKARAVEEAGRIVASADEEAGRIVASADEAAKGLRARAVAEAERDCLKIRQEASRSAQVVDEARKEAKQIASAARKEAKEKVGKVEETLALAIAQAREIRERADLRAAEIAGKAYAALNRFEFYESAADAMKNAADGYSGTYAAPADHPADLLAQEYSFHKSGERLTPPRDRTALMLRSDAAVECSYPVGWKRDYVVSFVIDSFNGKVDAVLARVKPANHGKQAQEIKDAFALVNRNGEVFKGSKVREEFLDARLDELKWAVIVQKLKDEDREQQRAIRERMRDEEKARKEYEKAIKQAEREEELLARAMEKARRDFDSASAEDRARYESKLGDLADKLRAAEEKNRRALSMAQQTRCGHVYVISNEGSFGDDVYKIGLTRRIEPLDRVKELGDASVPFGFDVHAMIYADDAPALEAALHRRFVDRQVNKVNRRKEFFRLSLAEIREAVAEMGIEARWTIAAEARDFRETLEMERQMRDDPSYRRRWADAQAAAEARDPIDDEEDGEDGSAADDLPTARARGRGRKKVAG